VKRFWIAFGLICVVSWSVAAWFQYRSLTYCNGDEVALTRTGHPFEIVCVKAERR
jgi:hypothetical protein